MKTYEVILEGIFKKTLLIDAEDSEIAEEKAEELFEKLIGLEKGNYTVDSISISNR